MSKINRNRIVLFAVFFVLAIAANVILNTLVASHYSQYFQVLNFKGIIFFVTAMVAFIPGFIILVNHYSRKGEF